MKTNKIYLSLFAFLACCLFGAFVYSVYHEVTDKHKLYFNDFITRIMFANGKEQLRSDFLKKYFGRKADKFLPYNDGDSIVIYKNKGRYGFMNLYTGEDFIHAEDHDFEYAWRFTPSGLAAILVEGKIGFIRKDGSYYISPQYEYKIESEENFIGFKDGFAIIPFYTKTGKSMGMIDMSNKFALQPEYSFIGEPEYSHRVIIKNGLWGLVDSAAVIRIKPSYNEISINEQGIVLDDGRRKFLISLDLKTVLSEFAFDEISPLVSKQEAEDSEYLPEEEESDVQTKYSTCTINGSVGIILNSTGKIIIKPSYDKISYLYDGIFKCMLNDKYFLIDEKGNFIQ